MTLNIVKRNEQEFADWLATEWGFLCGLATWEDEPLVLEPYQVRFLQDRSKFRWVTKSRQVGFSFLFALEALAHCHLRHRHTGVFISYNLDDAKEKILMARQIHEDLPLSYQKRLVVDSKTELVFESNAANKRVSRIVSGPSKAPRGKRGSVYLDELAHYVNDRDVYRGSTALILRAQGQLSGASTPLGRRGIFWEIATEELRKYPHHSRHDVPWWVCRFFCSDVPRATVEAPNMSTQERVEKFGAPAIVEQFDSLPLEDFQQEFEGVFVDESYSFFPYDLVLPCTTEDLRMAQDPTDLFISSGRIVAGFDVGRTRDRSELAVFEQKDDVMVCRMLKRYEQVPFAEQEGSLRRLLDTVPVTRLSIDRSGIGMNLAENLAKEYPQVVPENFTNENKERWATDLKILFQRRHIVLPRERELVAQVHSIKRKVLPSGKASFDSERTTRGGHADRFWAIALACQQERGPGAKKKSEIGVRVLG